LIELQGCDGSVLLDGANTEKMAAPNVRLEGFGVVDQIKAALEAACPGVVSCADLLAFAARDGVRLTGGVRYSVPAGRRDGMVSIGAQAVANLPDPKMGVDHLTSNFKKQGLTRDEMVTLSGAHTIGDVACHHIDNRLYKFHETRTDPSLPPAFAAKLKAICPRPGLFDVTVDMDQVTPLKFDTQYYKNLQAKKSVLSSDQVLFTDSRTRPLVNKFAGDPAAFMAAFNKAMVKMGNINTLRGTLGEIRKNCRVVNSVFGAL
jgi:peroxidase